MERERGRHPVSRRLLVWGLPRDPRAAPHLTAMLVAAVATVLVLRGVLAMAGYPRIGGGHLHIAHVLWGGLLMVVALVLLLSFAGPVIRPLAAVLAGIGIGLFIDEIGKFVTSNNDYFYRPAAAIMYLVVVGLVLTVQAVHGRRPHHPAEHLAGVVDEAVAGVAGGLTPARRQEITGRLERAAGAPGHPETVALVEAIPDDPYEFFDPVRYVNPLRVFTRLRRRVRHRRGAARALTLIVVLVMLAQTISAVLEFAIHAAIRFSHEGVPPGPLPPGEAVGVIATALATVPFVIGLVRLRGNRAAAFTWFFRSVLVNVLLTRVIEFDVAQFVTTIHVVVDLALLAVIGAELARMRAASPEPAGADTDTPD